MPFQSSAQMKWMFANKPAMAKRWAAETPDIKNLPSHVVGSSFDALAKKKARKKKQ